MSPIAIQKNEQCFLEEAGLAEPRLWVLPGQAGFCLTPLFPLEIEGGKNKKKPNQTKPKFCSLHFSFPLFKNAKERCERRQVPCGSSCRSGPMAGCPLRQGKGASSVLGTCGGDRDRQTGQ